MLVTGAGGFVGGQLVRSLRKQGYSVRAMVRNPEQSPELRALGAEVVIADLGLPETLASVVDGVTGVFHVAALFRQAGLPESEFLKINADGTRHLLDAAVAAGVERFIYCSTVGVLGGIEDPPADETAPFAPGDMYQRSKMEGEKLALEFFRSGKIGGCVIRPAMIYGPGDTRTLKIFKMIAAGRFFYVGSGEAFVHFVDVRDLARAFILAMEHRERNAEVYIIGGARAVPLKDFARRICGRLGVKPPRLHLPVKPMQWLGSLCEALCTPLRINPPLYRRRVDFYTKNRHFDCSKAARELGFVPALTLNQELEDIIADYRARGWLPQGVGPNRIEEFEAKVVRSIEGSINAWDAGAERKYGWNAKDAVGKISHQLFQTQFPAALSEINRQLMTRGRWSGVLVHSDRSGRRIRVASHWELEYDNLGNPLQVVETNRELDGTSRRPPAGNVFGLAAGFIGQVAELLPEIAFLAPRFGYYPFACRRCSTSSAR